jgi:N6-L-threonylcarbamoyladenine synthase
LLSGTRLLEDVREEMARGQAERILPLCADLLDRHGQTPSDLTAIGVGIGPGNFTGIRIAVSAARGLALGLGIPAVGVNAFDALRYGSDGPCACAVVGPRDMIYFQRFDETEPTEPQLIESTQIPAHDGPLIGVFGQAPANSTAAAIAFLARDRFADTRERPAPLYLRPADAAPARDAPPVILP